MDEKTTVRGRINKVSTTNTLPLIGRIKVGMKVQKEGGKEYTTSLDYFRATGKYAQLFDTQFGEKCSRFGIVFITDNLEEACNQYYAAWEKGKLWGSGNGEVFRIWDPTITDSTGKVVGGYVENVPKTDPRVAAIKGWAEYVDLNFVIPSIQTVLGYWKFTTKGSKTSIPSIIKSFDFIKERAGTVVGFPFDLVVEKPQSYTPGAPRSYPVVQLIANRGEENIVAIKNFITAGGHISDVASISMDENKLRKMLQSKEEVPAITVDAQEVRDGED